ncbi:sulfotransferase domain-containing protein [Microbispora hainanensis]|uniref:sulfotransferase n=1 Tax=Microbispora TaxID=2005 RepID=UPI001159175B|nr:MULTISPECIES: sulfotransferase [Microbispora]NJP25601.1 sulfotransferase [Microbispora sp. CL1-1]TQS13550.1 sulfotransferase [Microbispora sp. SCL1-1]
MSVRDLLPESVLGIGRSAFRAYGMATARARKDPDFLLIGAKRGGSTSLYYALLEHPGIIPLFPSADLLPKANHTKGVHFFDSNYERGMRWYRSHLPSQAARGRAARRSGMPVLTGEASPYYLYHPLAAQRAGRDVPDARILLILRDPVERTFSHYRERVRNGAEHLSFEEALDAEAERTAGEEERLLKDPGYRSYAHEQQSYVAQSEYEKALRRWFDHFPADRFHVTSSEEFYRDPQRVCDEAAAFLGLPPAPLARAGKVWNSAPKAEISASTKRRLIEHFAPHNAALEKLVGRSFPDWAAP